MQIGEDTAAEAGDTAHTTQPAFNVRQDACGIDLLR